MQIKILTLLLMLIANTAYAEMKHYNDITSYPKVVDFYVRYDTTKQPLVWKTNLTGKDLLQKVNQEINGRVKYKPELFGGDYWQLPSETNTLRTGDCEDFAIAKWYELLQNGIPEADMWFLQGINKSGIMHATLQVFIDNRLYYLDNEIDDITINNINPLGSYIINRYGVTYYVESTRK